MAFNHDPLAKARVWLGMTTSSVIVDSLDCLFTNQSLYIVVTGSSQGLGHSIVSYVLRKGDRVVATSRSLSSLHSLRNESDYSASQLLILPLDVTNVDQVRDVFEKTKEQFGRLDVVVNNAGYGVNGEMESTPNEVARQQMEVCFWGAVHVMREVSVFRIHQCSEADNERAFCVAIEGDSVFPRG